MVEVEPLNGTIEDDYLEVLVRFNCRDDLAELQNKFRTHQIKRWVVKCDAPAGRRYPVKPYLRCLRVRQHWILRSSQVNAMCRRILTTELEGHQYTKVSPGAALSARSNRPLYCSISSAPRGTIGRWCMSMLC